MGNAENLTAWYKLLDSVGYKSDRADVVLRRVARSMDLAEIPVVENYQELAMDATCPNCGITMIGGIHTRDDVLTHREECIPPAPTPERQPENLPENQPPTEREPEPVEPEEDSRLSDLFGEEDVIDLT